MNRITYSLNYRKPKHDYNLDDELVVCLRYFYKKHSDDKGKIIKKSTGVKCKLSDWDTDWHKSPNRFPIKSSDKLHLKKK
jgi:hypothetical protein